MMRKKFIAYAALIAASLTTGCGHRINLSLHDAVARVGDEVLYRSDVEAAVPAGMTPEDSLLIAESHINSWIRNRIKLLEAEKILQDIDDIEEMVNNYRSTLLVNRLEKYYIDNRVDSLISDSLVAEYYASNGSEFELDRNIVKGRVVRVPSGFRQEARLKELMGSPKSERQQDFLDMTIKNNLLLTSHDGWIAFDDFLGTFPTVRGKNYDYLLTSGKINEFSDGDYKYFVQITEYIGRGEQAPLEWIDNIIRNIIFNRRSGEVIRDLVDSLYNAALNSNTLHLYSNRNND